MNVQVEADVEEDFWCSVAFITEEKNTARRVLATVGTWGKKNPESLLKKKGFETRFGSSRLKLVHSACQHFCS